MTASGECSLDLGSYWGARAIYTPYTMTQTCGTLISRDTKILDLFHREGIELELLSMPEPSGKGKDAAGDTPTWATLYGSRDLAPDLGDTLQGLQLYLQDPTHAQRDPNKADHYCLLTNVP